jgi:hypothetical protein
MHLIGWASEAPSQRPRGRVATVTALDLEISRSQEHRAEHRALHAGIEALDHLLGRAPVDVVARRLVAAIVRGSSEGDSALDCFLHRDPSYLIASHTADADADTSADTSAAADASSKCAGSERPEAELGPISAELAPEVGHRGHADDG